MVFALFKYANFIHHYSDHEKQNTDKMSSEQNQQEKTEP